MSVRDQHKNKQITVQATKIDNDKDQILVPFHQHEDFLHQKTGLQLGDHVRFEISATEPTKDWIDNDANIDGVVCLEAYNCTETILVNNADDTCQPFSKEKLSDIVETANPDMATASESMTNVRDLDQGPDGNLQTAIIDCSIKRNGRSVRFETIIEASSEKDYHYRVKTTYKVSNQNNDREKTTYKASNLDSTDTYETLAKIRVPEMDSGTLAPSTEREVRLSLVVHPEKEFDPNRVPGNEAEAYKIGQNNDYSYDRHVTIPKRFRRKSSHIYCKKGENFKRRNESCKRDSKDGDCSGEHLENPFPELSPEEHDKVIIEYNDNKKHDSQWVFRIYYDSLSYCPLDILDEAEENQTYSGIGLSSTAVAVILDEDTVLKASLSCEEVNNTGDWDHSEAVRTQKFKTETFQRDIDRLLTAIRTANSESTRVVRAKALQNLTHPDTVSVEDATAAINNIQAIERLLNLLDCINTVHVQEHLCGALHNMLHEDLSLMFELNTILEDNFASVDGPNQLLDLIEDSDHLEMETNALMALHQANHGTGKLACDARKALIDANGINRLVALFKDVTDSDVRADIRTIFRCYTQSSDFSEAFIKQGMHEKLLTWGENSNADIGFRSDSIRALGMLMKYEPKSMARINAPERLAELVACSEHDVQYEAVSALYHFTRTDEGANMIVDTSATEQLLLAAGGAKQNQKKAVEAIGNIARSGHQELILRGKGLRQIIPQLTKNDDEDLQRELAMVLNCLSKSEQGKRAVGDANGPEQLLYAIERSESSRVVAELAGPIAHLAEDEMNQKRIIDANGVERLLTVFETYEWKYSADVIHNLTMTEIGRKAVIDADGPARLLDGLFKAKMDSNQKTLASALLNLSISESGKRSIRRANGAARIRSMLPASNKDVQDTLENLLYKLRQDDDDLGLAVAGAVVTGLLHMDSDNDLNSPNETKTDETTEYENRAIRAVANFSRRAGRVYGRVTVTIRRQW